jgi:hypothetical protein
MAVLSKSGTAGRIRVMTVVEEEAEPLKQQIPRMTQIEGLYGTARAVPFQNIAKIEMH